MPTTTITYTENDIIALLAKEHGAPEANVTVDIIPEVDDGPRGCNPATFTVSVDLKPEARTSNLP